MQTLIFLAALGLVQEPPLQIPPPPMEAPAAQAPTQPSAPATPLKAPPQPVQAQVPAPAGALGTAVTAAPLSFYSEKIAFAWDRTIPLSIDVDGLKVTSIFFNKRIAKILKGAEFGTRAQVEVTNTGKHPKVPGFATAVFDKDGRLLGVASGGTKFGTIKPGETETFDLNFSQVKERLSSGETFFLAIELSD
jgi:hypothetical protein